MGGVLLLPLDDIWSIAGLHPPFVIGRCIHLYSWVEKETICSVPDNFLRQGVKGSTEVGFSKSL